MFMLGQGTNILIQNGLGAGQKVPHFAMEVIPRREEDGLQLQWPSKEMTEDELDISAQQLREETAKLGDLSAVKEKKAEAKEETKKTEEKKTEVKPDNIMVKSLKRIP